MNSRMYYRLSLFAAATLLVVTYSVRADEEEFLELTEVRIVGYDRVKTGVGNVVFTAKVAGSGGKIAQTELKEVTIEVFEKPYTLGKEMLAKLQGFPLDSLQITHSPGRSDGPGVYFRMYQQKFDAEGRQHQHSVLFSVNKSRGLRVDDPEVKILPKKR